MGEVKSGRVRIITSSYLIFRHKMSINIYNHPILSDMFDGNQNMSLLMSVSMVLEDDDKIERRAAVQRRRIDIDDH